jgi:recombinational DNA repair protein (RecF pathway)
MSETRIEVCGKCDAEIDPTRRVDFTLKDGAMICQSCFLKETSRPNSDWHRNL